MKYFLDLSESIDAIYQTVGLVPLDETTAQALIENSLVRAAYYESDGAESPAFITLSPKT